jgi:hypothetical protein
MRRIAIVLVSFLAACGAPRGGADPADPGAGRMITPESFKPLTDTYREYVGALVRLGSVMPAERADGLRWLEVNTYAFFSDDRALIARASAGDEAARIELVRRGRVLDAIFAFWGKVDLPKWNDARRTICSLGEDARIVLVTTLLRMLLNGQYQSHWPSIRFQLVEIGDEALETSVGLFRAKAEVTPDTIIFKEDDLVQVGLVILGFGEKGRPAIDEFAKSPRFNVRKAIARAVGEGRVVEHLPLVRGMLSGDAMWVVRAAAAKALGELRPARSAAGAALMEALSTERDRSVRPYIVSALGKLVYEDAVPILIRTLEAPDYDLAEKTMFALCQITGERLLTQDAWRRWYQRDYVRWRGKLRQR